MSTISNNNIPPSPTKAASPSSPKSPTIKEWAVTIDDQGKIRINMSPSSEKRGGIYAFKVKPTCCRSLFNEKLKIKRYIGSVVPTKKNNFKKRNNQYHYKINTCNNKREVEQVISDNPSEVTYCIYKYYDPIEGDDPNETRKLEATILEDEGNLQELFQTRNPEKGYNKTNPKKEPSRVGRKKLL